MDLAYQLWTAVGSLFPSPIMDYMYSRAADQSYKPTILNMKCLSMLNSRENSWEWSELALQMAFTTVILEGLHISKSL